MTHLKQKAGDKPLTYLSVKVCVAQVNLVVVITVLVSCRTGVLVRARRCLGSHIQ